MAYVHCPNDCCLTCDDPDCCDTGDTNACSFCIYAQECPLAPKEVKECNQD